MQTQNTSVVKLLLLSLVLSLSLIFSGCDTDNDVVDEGIGVEEGVGEEGIDEEGIGEEED